MRTCDFCGDTTIRVHKIRGSEKLQCRACYLSSNRKDSSKASACSVCGKLHYAQYRTKHFKPICGVCRYQSTVNCWACGKLGTYHAGRCKKCYESDKRKVKECAECNRVFEYRFKSTKFCLKCRNKHDKLPRGVCSKCNRSKVLPSLLENGGRICGYCYKKYYMKHTPCEMCGKITFCFNNFRVGKSICIQCSNKVRRNDYA